MIRHVLITAGPTREFFDPVRFLSNPSTGRMGYAIAEASLKKGFRVTLVSGPTSLEDVPKARMIRVVSASEMHRAVMKECAKADLIIMTAAVSDYRPKIISRQKIKKEKKTLAITLAPTQDILYEVGLRKKKGQVLVGFAAETHELKKNALGKIKRKNLDFIVANRVGEKGSGFESANNQALLIDAQGDTTLFPLMSKKKLAVMILDAILKRMSHVRSVIFKNRS